MQYHPAYDSLHAAVRAIRVIEQSGSDAVDRDTLAIVDYCLLFPGAIQQMKLPQNISRQLKSIARGLTNTYDSPLSNWLVFQNIQPVHRAAVRMLLTANVLDYADESQTKLKKGKNFAEWFAIVGGLDSPAEAEIVASLRAIPSDGPDGLKARSRLMEYRYDVL